MVGRYFVVGDAGAALSPLAGGVLGAVVLLLEWCLWVVLGCSLLAVAVGLLAGGFGSANATTGRTIETITNRVRNVFKIGRAHV